MDNDGKKTLAERMQARRNEEGNLDSPAPKRESNQGHQGSEQAQETRLDRNPHAKRNYKTISLPLNAFEYDSLTEASQKVGRTKASFIRYGMMLAIEKVKNGEREL